MTDGVDAPAETEADAAVAAPGQHLVPVHAPRGYQVRRSLLAALAIAVLISVIVIERHTLAESLQVLTNLNVGWFVLAVAAETISLTSFGLSRTILVHVNGRQIGFGSVMMITYAANALSISVPFAGAELAMRRGRQHRHHTWRVRAGRAGPDGRADRHRPAQVTCARGRAGVPSGELLAGPSGRVDPDGHPRPPPRGTWRILPGAGGLRCPRRIRQPTW